MIRLLFLRRLLEQPVRAVVAVVAVAAGVALSSGVFIGQASIDRALDGYADAISGVADLRVDGPVDQAGLPNSLLPALRAVPGVEAVAPTVVSTTRIEEPGGEEQYVATIGVDCAVLPLCAPGGGLMVSPALLDEMAPGSILRTNTGSLPLDAATPLPVLSSLLGGRLLALPLAEAQSVFARSEWFDTAFVTIADGATVEDVQAGLAAAAGPTSVVRSVDLVPIGADVIGQLVIGLLLVSVVGLLIGAQLIANTLALSLEERRRELATVAAVGATPAMLARGMVLEAAVLGSIGGLLGSFAGVLVARPAIAALNDQFARGLGVTIDVQVPAYVVAIGVVLGVAVALLASIRPARRLARIDIAAELVDRDRSVEATPGRRWAGLPAAVGVAAGLVIAALGARDGAIEPWQPIAAGGGMVLAIASGLRLPGQVARRAVRWASVHAAVTGPLRTALAGLAGDLRRTSVLAGAIAAPVALGVSLGGIDPGLERGARHIAELDVGEGVEVSPLPVNNAMTLDARFSPSELAAITAIPGVARVEANYYAVLDHPDIGLVGLGAEHGPLTAYTVFRGAPTDAPLAPGDAYVGPALARSRGLDPGDRMVVPGRDGPVDLVVRGVWADPERLGRSISVDVDTFTRIAGPRPASFVVLEPDADTTPAELIDRVEALDLRPTLTIGDAPRMGVLFGDEIEVYTAPFRAVQRGLLVVVIVATASTLLLSGIQRRREHALLGAIGMTASALATTTILEIAVLGIVATVVGGLVGVAGALAFGMASGVLTGLRLETVWTVTPLVVAVVPAVVAALVGAVLPALRTARIDPATALRYE